MQPKCLLLLVNDATQKGAWHVVGVYLSDTPIKTIMLVQKENGMTVEETFEPVKPWENGLECSWDESWFTSTPREDKIPSMIYTVTGLNGQFVRQFRVVMLPLIGGRETLSFAAFDIPEWAK